MVSAHPSAAHREAVDSWFEDFNEVVRTEGDVLTWVHRHFDPHAEYRPIEDDDWFRDPEAIARSLERWIEVWGVGQFRVTVEALDEVGDDVLLITARNRGVGRVSGVPIEATTYFAQVRRGRKIQWSDEYLDREAALAAARAKAAPAERTEPDVAATRVARLMNLGQAAFGAFVRRRSDRQLERLFGSAPALRALMKALELRFQPAKAAGFTGEVQIELVGPDDTKRWVVQIDRDRATARPGIARDPATTLTAPIAPFIRVAAGQVHPVAAYREGLLDVSGDFQLGASFGVMFGLTQ